jgi:tRNA pseudouridine55 synthase
VTAGAHGVLLVDKPAGVSSHGVVAVARRALGTRRVGHAGTLDPMATGLLVLAVGEGLKAMRYLALDDKRYWATLRLGQGTDTLDAQGRVDAEAVVPEGLEMAEVQRAADSFLGESAQRAPVVSAIKRDGVPLYARVRRGEQVQAPVRHVVVHSLHVLSVRADPAEVDLEVACGKGFYVRALGRDLAAKLGTVGHLTALRRTRSGHFDVDDAVPMERLRQAADGDEAARDALASALLDLSRSLPSAPVLCLDARGVEDARHGRPVERDRVEGLLPADSSVEPVILLDAEARPVALGRVVEDRVQVVRGVHWS